MVVTNFSAFKAKRRSVLLEAMQLVFNGIENTPMLLIGDHRGLNAHTDRRTDGYMSNYIIAYFIILIHLISSTKITAHKCDLFTFKNTYFLLVYLPTTYESFLFHIFRLEKSKSDPKEP